MKDIFPEKRMVLILTLISVILFCFPVISYGENRYYDPITEIDLGVKVLEMRVGDAYVFPMTHKPAETPEKFISWLADDSILRIDPEHRSVTAIAPGTTRLLVESNAGFTWDYCDVTVSGPESKDSGEKISGKDIIRLSETDREKILAKTLQNYLTFLELNTFTRQKLDEVLQRKFNVTAVVSPEAVETESVLAGSLGMEKALPLPDLHAVSLRGTVMQILAFTENNPNLVKIIEFAPMSIIDPVAEEDPEGTAKSITLGEHVETLTHVSVVHGKGITGEGTVVAVIDTGLNKDHEQFDGRVIAEGCFAMGDETYSPSCVSGSSAPTETESPTLHNHGSHVTGIAAGLGGIAPGAKIVSINISVEACSGDECVETMYWSPYEVAQYLTDLQDGYKENNEPLIVAVNMSLGNNDQKEAVCDDDYDYYKDALDLLTDKDNDMIPVVATGNNGWDGTISAPACISNAFRVGAISEVSQPTIANFSNHNELVSILAPGTEIRSAIYAYQNDDYISGGQCADGVGGTTNCYGISQGTSMATPMVTGAFALLKQAYPKMSAAQLEEKLTAISGGSANKKANGTTFSFSTPILDFTNMLTKPLVTGILIQNADGTDITGQTLAIDSGSYQLNADVSPVDAEQSVIWTSGDTAVAEVDETGLVTFNRDGTVEITASANDDNRISVSVTLTLETTNTCGENVKYVIDGNTISFIRAYPKSDAVWSSICGEVFRTNADITRVVIGDDIAAMEGYRLFKGYAYVQDMDLAKLDVSGTTSFYEMFSGCAALKKVDLSTWDISGVVSVNSMFNGCSSLTVLDVSGWDTSAVTQMEGVFAGCTSLNQLVLGQNSLGKNIFESLPNYAGSWYYIEQGASASNSLPLMTVKTDGALFENFDYNTMAGKWSAGPFMTSITIITPSGNTANGKTLTGYIGKSYTYTITPTPADASKAVTWKSSDTSVAAITAAGKASCKAVGSSSITATAADGSGVTASFILKCIPQMTSMSIMTPSGKVANGKTLTGYVGSAYTYTITPTPAAASKAVTWKSAKTSVATITTAGKATCKAAGSSVISAAAKDGSGVTASFTLKCAVPKMKSMSIMTPSGKVANGKTLTGYVGSAYTYTITPTPAAASKAVTWKSSKTGVVAITTAGKATCKAAGSAKITATAKDGSGVTASFTLKCAVPKMKSMSIITPSGKVANGKTLTGYVGKSYTYTITPTPAGASKAVTWKSSKTGVVAITTAGKATCKAAGSAKITATAKDGSGVTASFTLKCVKK